MTAVAIVLAVAGAAFALVAAAGLVRMPDLPTRMHASTKAGSLGAALVLAAVAVVRPDLDTVVRVFAAIGFLFLTAPVAAHVVARVAYRSGLTLWEGTRFDELAGRTREREPAPPSQEEDGA